MAMWWRSERELGHVAGCRYGPGLVGRGRGDRLFRGNGRRLGFIYLFVCLVVRRGRGETKHNVDER